MNLRDLEYFEAVADTGRFGLAADRCCVSQPTLSGQLRKLEEELGHALFERDTRNLRLTPFGKEALVLAREALQAVRRLERKAGELADPFCGPVTLGAFPTLGPFFLPRFSPLFMKTFPKAEFWLSEEKTPVLMEQIAAGTMDAAFLALPWEGGPDIEVLPLFREDFLVAVPAGHPWACRASLPSRELQGVEFLLLADGHCLRDQSLDLCSRYGAREKGYFRATGLETLREMVRMGTGITLMPRLAIPAHADPGIAYLPVDGEGFQREIGLCYRPTHPRRDFFDALAGLVRREAGELLPVEATGCPGE